MAVTSAHIYYPGGGDTAYDLRKVESWYDDADGTSVVVRFTSHPTATVKFVKSTFEVAKQASLDAEPVAP